MRVALVCPYDMGLPGGVQGQVRGLARALERSGDETLIVAPGPPEGPTGVSVGSSAAIPANRSRAPISIDPRVGSRIRQAVESADLVHVHEPLMPTVSLAALRARPPVVATFHAYPSGLGKAVYRLGAPVMRRYLERRVSRVTAVSEAAASVLPAGLETTIIPNAIDVAAFAGQEERVKGRVAFLGRDEPRKGLDVLLEAWHQVKLAVPEAELVVMGADRGADGVTWMRSVDDRTKSETLRSSEVFVAPNLGGESFGIILLEGMAAGAAVVASDLESFRGVGQDAVAYSAAGDPDGLANLVVRLLQDDDERRSLVDRARARVGGFDWSVVASRYRSVYEEALS